VKPTELFSSLETEKKEQQEQCSKSGIIIARGFYYVLCVVEKQTENKG